MACVTRCRLLRLREQHLLVPDEGRAEGFEFIREPAQPVGLYGACAARNLNDALIERHLSVECRHCVQCTVTAHHRRFDHHPHFEFDHKRDDAGIRKVDLPNRATRFGEHSTKL